MSKFNYLEECYNNIKSAKQNSLAIENLKNAYNWSRANITKANYIEIADILKACEVAMPYIFILDSVSRFEIINLNDSVKCLDSFSSHEEILNYIVNYVRNELYERRKEYYVIKNKTGIDKVDVANLCFDASEDVLKLCYRLRLEAAQIKIDPGYDEKLNLQFGNGFHYFCIVKIEDKKYLVDCTYKQFFDVYGVLLERLGLMGLNGCLAGIYMLLDESRKKTAVRLLENGWVELTEENMKNYFDGFTLSYYNALYYEWLGKIDFTTPYTANDYEGMIFGSENLSKHQPLETLGYQRRLLKNENIVFTTNLEYFK